jgi:hypothetical protein
MDRSLRGLRPDRRLIVAQRSKGRSLVYCPGGPLTRDEVDLTNDHFDTLCLTGLLPGKPTAVGESWKVPNAVAQALCNFEGLADQNLVCKLEEVKEHSARVSVKGTSSGIDLGASVKLSIDASYFFDTAAGKLTRMEWRQAEDREQGPASPASSLQTTITLTRAAAELPPSLSDVALVSVPEGLEPPEPLTQLEYRDSKAGFAMLYNRDWQTVSQSPEHLVMRLLDRGDFVAQLTLSPWTKAGNGNRMTPEVLRQAMSQTPGWQPDQEIQAGEVPSGKDRYVYRISSTGELEGSKVMQN